MFNHTGPRHTPALNSLTERATGGTPGNSLTSSAQDTAHPHTGTGSEEQGEAPHNPAGCKVSPNFSKGYSLAILSVAQRGADFKFRKAYKTLPLIAETSFLSPKEKTSDRYFNIRFWTRGRLRERHRLRQDSG